ncbi:MAG TPA: alanine racemase [bacterium]|nr:alanine racemase [bacterium]
MMLADLDTPILLVDLPRMERNIHTMAAFARDAGVELRPHVKTHKIPALAHLQLAAGARGVTVAKVGEAEVMADAGITDILVCYPILGEEKLERLAHLARHARIAVAVDSFEAARQLSEAAGRYGVHFELLLEVDSGLNRCGLPPGDPVVDLAKQVLRLDGLEISGVCTHAGHAIRAGTQNERDAIARHEGDSVVFTRDRLKAAGIRIREVSVGSSATVRVSGRVPGVTEIRPGTYIFNDYMQTTAGACSEDDCALTVLSTVVSRPSPDRVILDAGSKCLSSDFHRLTERMSGYGYIKGSRGTLVSRLSEEHGVVQLSDGDPPLAIGDRVEIIPNHACAALNLWDDLHGVRNGEVETVWPVLARGKVR